MEMASVQRRKKKIKAAARADYPTAHARYPAKNQRDPGKPTMKRMLLLAAIVVALSTQAHAQVDPTVARSLAATCANCHGTTGNTQGAVPSIAGQSKAELVQKITEFRDGKRPATIMHQLAKGYSPEQIDLIAGWLAQQKTR
jgi:cytochrome c553